MKMHQTTATAKHFHNQNQNNYFVTQFGKLCLMKNSGTPRLCVYHFKKLNVCALYVRICIRIYNPKVNIGWQTRKSNYSMQICICKNKHHHFHSFQSIITHVKALTNKPAHRKKRAKKNTRTKRNTHGENKTTI